MAVNCRHYPSVLSALEGSSQMNKLLCAFTALVASSLVAVSAQAENLVLYTSQPNEDAQATVDAFKAANPGLDVQWVRSWRN
jgi:iron(III) transport system substrate-binding protein